jgi:hypothetical protein
MRFRTATRARLRTASRITTVLVVAAAGLVGIAGPSWAVDPLTVVSPSRGPSGVVNSVTVTTTGANFSGPPAVEFSWQACPSTYTATAVPAAGTATGFPLTNGVQAATGVTIGSNPKTLTFNTPTTLALTTTPAQVSSSWYICVYASNVVGSGALVASTASAAYTIQGTMITPSASVGPSGGGNTVSITANTGTLTASQAVEFQYQGTGGDASCSATWKAAAAPAMTSGSQTAGVIVVPTTGVTLATGTTNKLNVVVPSGLALATGQQTAPYNICVYASAATTGALVSSTTTPYTVAGTTMALNAYQGPSGGGNTLTATSTANFTSGIAAEFQYSGTGAASACSATYTAPAGITVAGSPPVQSAGVLAAGVRTLTSTRIAITVPTALLLAGSPAQTSADYNVCVYSGTTPGTSALIAMSDKVYTISAAAVITTVSPATGSAQGGTVITVTGSNFPTTGLTVTIGGTQVPAGDVTVAANGNSFTAKAPAHAVGGPYSVVVATAAGTVTKMNAFTYTNGVKVDPNFAPSNKVMNTDVDITGTGFMSIDFSATDGSQPRASTGHVYLVPGTYNPAVNSSNKTLPEKTECINVLVISDTELICQLNLVTSFTAAEAYSTVADATKSVTINTTNGSALITATSGTFAQSDVGLGISVPSDTQFPNTTTIASVVDSTHATINAPAIADGSAIVSTVAVRGTTGAATVTQGSNTITASTGTFLPGDVGKVITASSGKLPTGTVITSVSADGSSATTSQPGAAAGTPTLTILGSNSVPVGTYTMTVVNNGAVGASGSSYTQSVISSQSTFTVADY